MLSKIEVFSQAIIHEKSFGVSLTEHINHDVINGAPLSMYQHYNVNKYKKS